MRLMKRRWRGLWVKSRLERMFNHIILLIICDFSCTIRKSIISCSSCIAAFGAKSFTGHEVEIQKLCACLSLVM